MFVNQISVYLENIKGSLSEVISLLGENGVDILALSVADTTSFGILRIITREDDIYKAMNCLQDAGHIVKTTEVMCICVKDEPNGLGKVLDMICKTGISIEYMYTLNRKFNEYAVLVIRTADKDLASSALSDNNIKVLSQNEINTL